LRFTAGAILASTLLGLAGHPGLAFANILHVPTEQPTIQAAINAAQPGDTVLIAPGTYFENINFAGKAITVTSEQGPAATIIDGGSLGPVATFATSENTQSVLSGVTLQHGQGTFAAGYGGGGIHIANASPTISGNVITNNTAGSFGGGIYVQSGSPVIKKNTIANNGQIPGWSGGIGGGIYISGTGTAQVTGNTISNNQQAQGSGGAIGINAASPIIQNNTISGNSAYSQGGAMYIINTSSPLVVQNLIIGNSAGTGGGVYWTIPSGSAPFLLSNTLSNNSATTQGSAVYVSGYVSLSELIDNIIASAAGTSTLYCDPSYSATPPIVKANDIFASTGAAYAGSCSALGGANGNLSLDPKFRNPASADYHLLTGSPAIDAGISDPALLSTDFDANPRVLDGDGNGTAVVDIGAYEAPVLDVTPPVTTVFLNPLPNPSGWNNTSVGVALTAIDNTGGTGVKQIQYTTGGTAQQVVSGSSANLVFSTEGIALLTYGALDNAGNFETPKSVAIKIDRTAPVISGMPAPGCTLSPAKHQMVTVAVVTASDALSGVTSLKVNATSNEPDSGTGGGDLPGDIVITGGTVQLRAERAPNGKGRIYSITANALDFAGNSSTATATCVVPR
jgi:predicted outer membrane repeat protein